MRIIRVFPRRTSQTPNDEYAFAGKQAYPGLFRPEADAVHVSVVFTWDIDDGYRLRDAWSRYYDEVIIGGPAMGDYAGEFVPGMYVRHGITFTSRGCNRRCPWCVVPDREGTLRTLDTIAPGWVVQDNNFLMCPPQHRQRVYRMLNSQPKAAKFAGGLDCRLLTDEVADELREVRISEVFLAADTSAALPALASAAKRLDYLRHWQRRCYVLIGYNGETTDQAHERLEAVWRAGCVPFAQLYQPPDEFIDYPPTWKQLARTWSRPAAMAALHGGYLR